MNTSLYKAEFRFYQELNDFLPKDKKGKAFVYSFFGKPTVKDAIESIGIPHTEVDLILVNQQSVGFDHHLMDGDSVSVYPLFESFDITPLIRLHPEPLRRIKFINDVHLGKLARYLRLLGFDTAYQKDFSDNEIIEKALEEKRIILTRDLGILKQQRVTHGYFLRNTRPKLQLKEVADRFHLKNATKPFTRCLECNSVLEKVDKASVDIYLDPETRRFFSEFMRCPSCNRIYWEGSHFDRMNSLVNFIIS